MAGRLTTHVLDATLGRAAAGVSIQVARLDGETRHVITSAVTDGEGRTERPLLADGELKTGTYELVFSVGDYFAAQLAAPQQQTFLSDVPVRFVIADASLDYHVPLLCSPWFYTAYRGT